MRPHPIPFNSVVVSTYLFLDFQRGLVTSVPYLKYEVLRHFYFSRDNRNPHGLRGGS
jgi:hypothetical protein